MKEKDSKAKPSQKVVVYKIQFYTEQARKDFYIHLLNSVSLDTKTHYKRNFKLVADSWSWG